MSSPENDSDKRPGIIESLLSSPGNLSNLVRELRRLNNNLESLQTSRDKVAELTEVLKDFRTMTAPLLGWSVKKDSSEESNK